MPCLMSSEKGFPGPSMLPRSRVRPENIGNGYQKNNWPVAPMLGVSVDMCCLDFVSSLFSGGQRSIPRNRLGISTYRDRVGVVGG